MSSIFEKCKIIDMQQIVSALKDSPMWKLLLGSGVIITGSYLVFFRGDKSPPGPIGFPLVGILPLIDRSKPHLSFINLAEKYGDICSFTLMGKKTILVSGEKNIHDIYVNRQDEFSNRITSVRMKILFDGIDDLALMDDGEKYRDLKKIAYRSLKIYGEGMEKVESVSNDIIGTFLDYLQENKEKPIDLKQKLKILFCDIIMSMTLNKKVDNSAISEFVAFSDQISELLLNPNTAFLEIFPWLKYFKIDAVKKLINLSHMRDKALRPIFNEKLNSFDSNDIRNVIDDAWNLMLQSKLEYKEDELYALQRIFIIAGFFTTATTIYNLFPILMTHKHVVDKMYLEIKENIGLNRSPRLEDRSNMPYTEATIQETHRFLSIVPLSLPHVTTKNCYLGGYKIKKGTSIFPNIWGLHNDEKIWGDPENFRPERFLDENGQLLPIEHQYRRWFVYKNNFIFIVNRDF